MLSKPLDLPMQVAKAFLKDMPAYFAGPNAIKRDEIARRQMLLSGSAKCLGQTGVQSRHQADVRGDEGSRMTV
jgi:hypothetical protein